MNTSSLTNFHSPFHSQTLKNTAGRVTMAHDGSHAAFLLDTHPSCVRLLSRAPYIDLLSSLQTTCWRTWQRIRRTPIEHVTNDVLYNTRVHGPNFSCLIPYKLRPRDSFSGGSYPIIHPSHILSGAKSGETSTLELCASARLSGAGASGRLHHGHPGLKSGKNTVSCGLLKPVIEKRPTRSHSIKVFTLVRGLHRPSV